MPHRKLNRSVTARRRPGATSRPGLLRSGLGPSRCHDVFGESIGPCFVAPLSVHHIQILQTKPTGLTNDAPSAFTASMSNAPAGHVNGDISWDAGHGGV